MPDLSNLELPEGMDYDLLLESHEYYLEVESLSKTAEWLQAKGIDINRFKLSKNYHILGWSVAPPNGKIQKQYYVNPEYIDAWNEMIGDAIELVWSDVLEYLGGDGLKIDYMTACHFITSDMYESFIQRLNSNVSGGGTITRNTLPKGVTEEDIRHGKELYDSRLRYWVLTDANRSY